jgi:hypothetical protein
MAQADMYRFMRYQQYDFPGQEEKVGRVIYNFTRYHNLTMSFKYEFVHDLDPKIVDIFQYNTPRLTRLQTSIPHQQL